MPSFLTPDNAPIDSDCHPDQPGALRLGPLDLPGHFSLQSAKSPANGRRPHSASHASNDSLDESSSQSTNMSVVTHDSALPNGNHSDTTATTAATTDGLVADEPTAVHSKPSVPRKPLPNGNVNMTLPDRSVTKPPVLTNGMHGPNGTNNPSHSTETSPKDGPNRLSYASANSGSVQPSPVEMHIRHVGRGDVVAVDGSSSSLTLKGSKPDHTSAAPNGVPQHGNHDDSSRQNQQPNSSPHRFSSPPAYTGATATASTSATLNPPPVPGALKHRHTLEVPKLAPGRGSRDGLDTAVASGRFSPTTATTPGGGARRASLSLMRRNTRSLQSDLPRDEIVPDDDALRWAEAIRQKRASKRKRLEEDDDRVLVGTKVDEKHANWVTAYNMLTGIRVSVSRTNAKLDRPLTDADFDAKQKSVVDIAGNELVPSAKYDFKFKDYAPWVFRHLRALFRLDPADYLVSLTGKYILSELGSPGKSGSFFYFSRDYKYIIKTIHHAEHKFLRKILKDYYNHVTDNPNTLLSQFYGLHRVKMPYGKKIHFVVMNNLFPPHRDIHQTFDLKGSTIGRDYKEENLAKNPRATLKDLNWLRRKQHLMLGLEKKRLFLEQLHRDVRLLQKLQIMDYSLLIGIHDLEKGNEENLRSKTLKMFNPGGDNSTNDDFEPHSVLMRTPSKLENQRKARELRQMLKAQKPIPVGQTSSSKMPDELEHSKDSVFYRDDGGLQATHEDNTPGEEIYYLGVIDCLTHYGMIKKIEHFWKGLSNDRDQISALPPHQYGERFLSFMTGITKSSEEAAREEIEQAEKAQALTAAGPSAADQEKGKGTEQRISWSGSHRRKSNAGSIPPAPTHKPPPPPNASPNGPILHMSQVAEQVMKKAEHQAARFSRNEQEVQDRVLRTTTAESGVIIPTTSPVTSPSSSNHLKHGSSPQATPHNERRESTSVLPILEEAAEASSTGARSRNSHLSAQTSDSDSRPLTPAKDGDELAAGFGNPSFSTYGSQRSRVPLTPPKSGGGHLKPDSADSGYAVMSGAGGRARSGTGGSSTKVKVQLSRESLDKALPPLPKEDGAAKS